MKTKGLLLAIITLSILSCNSNKKKGVENTEANLEITTENSLSSPQESIENTKWLITTLEGQDMSDREANGQEIYFILDATTKSISGNSGCNTFMGTYALEEGNRISFSKLASTRMMCPDSKINESQIINIFELVDNFTITGGKLSLNKAKRAPLAEFKKVEMSNEPIIEKYWKLKTLEGQEITMLDKQEKEIYFTLKAKDNRVTGFAGCNNISGEYTLENGNRIRFINMATTLKACPDLAVKEDELLAVFELVDNYTITNDVLSLNVGRRAPLAVFEAVYF